MIKINFPYIILYTLVFLTLTSCQKTINTKYNLAFYHWQQHFNLDHQKNDYLHQLNSKTIYLRFFDVDWHDTDQVAYPVSILSIDSNSTEKPLNIIPTIFITNRVFQKIEEKNINDLAHQILKKINDISKKLNNAEITAIQIDCDWSKSTKTPYFQFLTTLKEITQKENKKLTTTIRLHQIKYAEKTGVPPVDRGILMCYNTGKLDDWNTDNSILTLNQVKQYIAKEVSYPIPLDLALPIFQWGILFRDGRLTKLIHELDYSELEKDNYFKKIKDNRYEVTSSTYLHGHYLYPGDLIRIETMKQQTLIEVSQYLKDKLPKNDNMDIIFYHLNNKSISKYSYSQLAEVFHTLTNNGE